MTDLDDAIRPVVEALLNDLGKSMTFHVVTTPGTYSPADGEVTGEVKTDYVQLASPPLGYSKHYVATDTIRAGDVQIFLAGLGLAFTPVVGMEVTIDGEKWEAVSMLSHYSGNLIAAYEIQLRRGPA